MSAGVDWPEAGDTVIGRLKHELDTAVGATADYGRSSGGKVLTDLLAHVERRLAGRRTRVAAVITGGTCDGAHVVATMLSRDGRIRAGDRCLAIGLSFPYYYELFTGLGLDYVECIDEQALMPSTDEIVQTVETVRPRVIVLMLPHNPTGCLLAAADYARIIRAARSVGAVVFCDRVCMMTWDYTPDLMGAFHDATAAGDVFVFDSLAKSDSLAGLRVGYLLCAPDRAASVEREIRYRILNPIVFGTPTLVFARLATLGYAQRTPAGAFLARLLSRYSDRFYRDYPVSFRDPFEATDVQGEVAAYNHEQDSLRRRIQTNFAQIEEVFGADVVKPLRLDGGFNVLLETGQMAAERECEHQIRLWTECAVAVLTERCFRASKVAKATYAVRLGLSLEPAEFRAGLDRLQGFYAQA
ncbi:MAG: pyridoxal phosphate-dependent aminotransferase [Rhodovibrio sp.]|nr:pyridoxal phosphate-dependent aminotransferase [Rhodovibrio sp.]